MEKKSKSRFLIISGFSISSLFGVIIGESWIIALVIFLGPFLGFIALSIISTIISLIVLFAYGKGDLSNLPTIRKINRWAKNKEKNINPISLRLLKLSKIAAFIFSSVTAGPFITIIFSKVFANPRSNFYLLAVTSSLLFSLTWVIIYSGAIILIREIITGLTL